MPPSRHSRSSHSRSSSFRSSGSRSSFYSAMGNTGLSRKAPTRSSHSSFGGSSVMKNSFSSSSRSNTSSFSSSPKKNVASPKSTTPRLSSVVRPSSSELSSVVREKKNAYMPKNTGITHTGLTHSNSTHQGSFAHKNRKPLRENPSFPAVVEHSSVKPMILHCYFHDYAYYDSDFVGSDGVYYDKGYYDETGKYYPELVIEDKPIIQGAVCKYCGTNVVINFDSIDTLEEVKCSSCGASIDLKDCFPVNTDYRVEEVSMYSDHEEVIRNEEVEQYFAKQEEKELNNQKWKFLAMFFPFAFCLIIPISTLVMIAESCDPIYETSEYQEFEEYQDSIYYEENDDYLTTIDDYNVDLLGQIIYVPEIDRQCTWSRDYECYYDNITDCYFVYNSEISVPQVQYWYEDYSSAYGDYGWLEYDVLEDMWYVEINDGVWKGIDNPPDYFWHTSYDSILKANTEE